MKDISNVGSMIGLLDPDIEESIKRYILHVRQMQLLTDEQLTVLLRQAAIEKPEMFETLKEGAQKKIAQDIKKMIKDTTKDCVTKDYVTKDYVTKDHIAKDPVKFARKVA